MQDIKNSQLLIHNPKQKREDAMINDINTIDNSPTPTDIESTEFHNIFIFSIFIFGEHYFTYKFILLLSTFRDNNL